MVIDALVDTGSEISLLNQSMVPWLKDIDAVGFVNVGGVLDRCKTKAALHVVPFRLINPGQYEPLVGVDKLLRVAVTEFKGMGRNPDILLSLSDFESLCESNKLCTPAAVVNVSPLTHAWTCESESKQGAVIGCNAELNNATSDLAVSDSAAVVTDRLDMTGASALCDGESLDSVDNADGISLLGTLLCAGPALLEGRSTGLLQ